MAVYFDEGTRKLLLHLKLFQDLTENELDQLLAKAELAEYEIGAYVIREGGQGHELFILLAGNAVITKRSWGGEKIIKHLEPGECFGEMSLIDCRSRSASIKATTHCKLLRLDGDYVVSLREVSTKIYRNIAIMLSQKLRNANELLTLG
jgi:CRP-like cAMP-binding protein